MKAPAAVPPLEIARMEEGTSGQSKADQLPTAFTMANHPIVITIQDLSYSVPDVANRKAQAFLLRDVNAYFLPSRMSALMGPSGSGKTTLLDILAGRKTTGQTEGQVLFSGVAPSLGFIRRYTGYVEQFDTLLGILTVEEMLMYTAELKRHVHEPLASKKMAVDRLIDSLGLTSCRNVKIGNSLEKGISGGQAKRTNIGIALITQPRVLYLDEPTTGLDSYTANSVMSVVQRLAHGGVTVVATIHSPTSFCFSLFDSLYMLVRGRPVYFGAPFKQATEYFSSFSHLGSGPGHNSAEFIVDLITEADRDGKGGEYSDHYAASQLAADNLAALNEQLAEVAKLPEDAKQELTARRATTTPWWWGLRTFIAYRTSHNYRDPSFIAPRVLDKVVIGLLIMTLYLGVGDDPSNDNVVNISAILFMWAATPGFAAAGYMPSLVLERGLFVRERSDGLYLVITYLTAKLFDELLINVVASLGVAAFVFYGVQLQGSFGIFWISYMVALCTGICLAYFVAAISPSMQVANALLPIYGVTLMFFAGFLIRLPAMPPWWYWYSVIDFARYSWSAVTINQFKHITTPFLNGQTPLEYYGLDGMNESACIGYCSLFFIFFFVATWITLSNKSYNLR